MRSSPDPVRVDLSDELGLPGAIRWLRRSLRWLLLVPALAAGVAAIVVFLIPSRWASSTTILPESRGMGRLPAGLGGLAGQLGLAIPSEGGASPQFYAEAVQSRRLIDGLLARSFVTPRTMDGAGRPATLLALLDVSGRTPGRRHEKAVEKLRKRMVVTTNTKSGTVTVRFEGPDPVLAKQVLDSMLADLNTLNLTTRRSQAKEKRQFLETRVGQSLATLRSAEWALTRFQEANRAFTQSPALRSRETELRRRADQAEQVYTTLAREYETVRIQEFDEVPVFSVIDPPYVSGKPAFPKRGVWIGFSAVLAFLGTAVWMMSRDTLVRAWRSSRSPGPGRDAAPAGAAGSAPPRSPHGTPAVAGD